ncbi:hypothetical protein O3P69_003373 [Scylla paramamosain]|uniref:Uncharacterized protein n=1 Tax=Scylla paramamosain TaxID=85552 RepID=A0AAW0UI55_SCYPA
MALVLFSVSDHFFYPCYNVEINDITTKPRVYCEPFQRCSMKGEDEEIEALKRKRAVAKGKFTREGQPLHHSTR